MSYRSIYQNQTTFSSLPTRATSRISPPASETTTSGFGPLLALSLLVAAGSFIILNLFFLPDSFFSAATTIDSQAATTVKANSSAVTPTLQKSPQKFPLSSSDVVSSNVMLFDLEKQQVLFAVDETEQIYPASLTKIMTALVAIEHSSNLSQTVTLKKSVFSDLEGQNAALAGFLPGEKVTQTDLLYGTMLASGAECSLSLAVEIAGSEEKFVQLMNQKVRELGLKNTHFENVVGLHDPQHYTTAQDLTILLLSALKNDTFRQVFTSSRYLIKSTNKHPEGFTIQSTMNQKISDLSFDGGEILGGKTGYTAEAGLCLASLAEKNGHEYILVTTGADGNHFTEQFHLSDALDIYEAI